MKQWEIPSHASATAAASLEIHGGFSPQAVVLGLAGGQTP